jgi:NTP pyrophosphatase (non-canonical NTP hydrolase)
MTLRYASDSAPTNFRTACFSLNTLADEFYEVAKKSGFHDEPVPVAVSVANLHGEVSELWESFRKQTLNQPCDKASKMEKVGVPSLTCLEEELADIVIRALDTAKEHNVDIGRAVLYKNAFNATRSYKHGGKIA